MNKREVWWWLWTCVWAGNIVGAIYRLGRHDHSPFGPWWWVWWPWAIASLLIFAGRWERESRP